jgi:hypothetical protein
MQSRRILSFVMSEKLGDKALDLVAAGKAADPTQQETYAASSVSRDISFDF